AAVKSRASPSSPEGEKVKGMGGQKDGMTMGGTNGIGGCWTAGAGGRVFTRCKRHEIHRRCGEQPANWKLGASSVLHRIQWSLHKREISLYSKENVRMAQNQLLEHMDDTRHTHMFWIRDWNLRQKRVTPTTVGDLDPEKVLIKQ
ncbi:hypothetical protein A2U01_0026237, partial [Trifolium medium]|nr:hypothetical protein [Trifolium medium]